MSDSKAAARAAIVLGLLALAAIPVAVVVSSTRPELKLLQALLIAVPVAFVLGLVAVGLSRRARRRFERSVRRNGARLVRTARLVAWSGVYVAVTGGLALAFYGILRASS
jgi:hypothetical protein